MQRWYYLSGINRDVVNGPYEEDALKEMFKGGALNAATCVCKEGEQSWVLASHTTSFASVAKPPHPAVKKRKISSVKVVGGIALTLVMVIVIFFIAPSAPKVEEIKAAANTSGVMENAQDALERLKNSSEEVAAGTSGPCTAPSWGMKKAVGQAQDALKVTQGQIELLENELNAQRAALDAIDLRDASAPTPAKVNAMRGAYDTKYGKYERLLAKYREQEKAVNDKVRELQNMEQAYEACRARATQPPRP
jgi:ABC-type transporter MlaC component